MVAAWLLLPTGGYLFHEVGYLDQLLYALLFAAIWLVNRSRWAGATAVMVAAVLTHEIALLTVLPVLAYVALPRLQLRQSAILLGLPALIAAALLLVIPSVSDGARGRLIDQMSASNFRPRSGALDLYERSLTDNWQAYSVARVLLFLAPVALLAVVGMFVLARLGGRAVPLLAIGALAAPALLALGGVDRDRWAFLLLSNFVLVLWLWLDGREMNAPQVAWLGLLFLASTHIPLTYFDGYEPREVEPADLRQVLDAVLNGPDGSLIPKR